MPYLRCSHESPVVFIEGIWKIEHYSWIAVFGIIVPTAIAFIQEVRRMYDEYLAAALPNLSEEQLIQTTPHLSTQRFKAGEVIIRQGDPAGEFYILTKGEAAVIREQNGEAIQIATLIQGQYFGEVGLMHGGKRMATVTAISDVEVLALKRKIFRDLMEESEMTKAEIDQVIRQRVEQTKEIASGLGIKAKPGQPLSITQEIKKMDLEKEIKAHMESKGQDS